MTKYALIALLALSSLAVHAEPSANKSFKSAVSKAKVRNKNGDICGKEATEYDILSKLEQAVAKNQLITFRIQNNKHLNKAMGGNLRFQELAGNLENFNDIEKLLVGVTFFGPAPGVYGHMSSLTFKANGKLVSMNKEINDEGVVREVNTDGAYQIVSMGEHFAVVEVVVGTRKIQYVIKKVEADGSSDYYLLTPEQAQTNQRGEFANTEDECSA